MEHGDDDAHADDASKHDNVRWRRLTADEDEVDHDGHNEDDGGGDDDVRCNMVCA